MGRCRRHPHHSVVGVCAHCLNDRLLALMEEEEDEELMLQGLYDRSPLAYYFIPPPPSMALSKQGLPSPAIFARRASTDYNRADVKQLATSYLHKHHHSLSSSPQVRAPYTKPAPRHRPVAFEPHPPSIAGQITRKKRPSLWSILLGNNDDGTMASRRPGLNTHRTACLHMPRDDYSGIVKMHRISSKAEELSGALRQRLENSWKIDANLSDRHARHAMKSSLSSSKREGHGSSSKTDGSLVSSPYMASPTRQGQHHHFPSPISKYASPSPLQHESRYGVDERVSPRRQVPVSYGLSGHAGEEDDGVYAPVQDDDTVKSTGIFSSIFHRRHRRSKSISGNDVGLSQTSRLHSLRASPESGTGPRGRRNSASFLEESKYGSPSRYIAAKLSQSNGIGIGFNSPDIPHRSAAAYEHLLGIKTSGTEPKASKQQFKLTQSSFHGGPGELMGSHSQSSSCGRSANEIAVSLSSPIVSKSPKAESMNLKSPRAKLINFLSKRKNGTVSIDCGRDARVSPVPMLKVKRDYRTPYGLHDDQDSHCQYPKQDSNLLPRQKTENHGDGLLRCADHCCVDRASMDELPKSRRGHVNDTGKSPRLMSLHAMKQLLKSPKLAPVRTSKEPDEDDGQPHSHFGRSLSKAFTKTLSPMLGRKPKRSHSIRKQASVHAQTHHGYGDSRQKSDEGPVKQKAQYSPFFYGNQSAAQKHHIQYGRHGAGCNEGDELLVRETHVLPAHDEKGPPQQYSFLSKDYSAFSFYFSPRRPGSIDGTARTLKKSSA